MPSSVSLRGVTARIPTIDVMTPMSGRAISASSRICPEPRIASSATTTSVSGSISQRVSGTPISLLKPSRAATMRTRPRSSAARMSFVEVFPTEPVIATTRALLRSRTARPSAAIAAKPSSGTSVAAAPWARASSRNAAPPPIATKRSPGDTRRESISIPVTCSASPSSRPRPRIASSGSGIRCAPPVS